jgi:hypothetical protein
MYTPPPLRKIILFPFLFATGLAAAIAYFTPEVGPSGYVSAWIGTVLVMTIWGLLKYERNK